MDSTESLFTLNDVCFRKFLRTLLTTCEVMHIHTQPLLTLQSISLKGKALSLKANSPKLRMSSGETQMTITTFVKTYNLLAHEPTWLLIKNKSNIAWFTALSL